MQRMDELVDEVVKSFEDKERVWGMYVNGRRVRTNSGSIAWKEHQHAVLALYQHISSLIYTWYDKEEGTGYWRIGEVRIKGYRSETKAIAKELIRREIVEIKKLPE